MGKVVPSPSKVSHPVKKEGRCSSLTGKSLKGVSYWPAMDHTPHIARMGWFP